MLDPTNYKILTCATTIITITRLNQEDGSPGLLQLEGLPDPIKSSAFLTRGKKGAHSSLCSAHKEMETCRL